MNLFNFLLTLHVAAAAIALIAGSYVMFAKKGDKNHKLIGSIYFYAMLTSAVVALPMSYLHPNYFLFIIGIFTSYMLITGKFYLQKKKIDSIKITDWILTITMFLFGSGFIGFGFYNFLNNNSFGIVFMVFGAVSMLFVYQDYINFTGKSKIKNYWLTTHIQRMVGSYIASVTAFIVVNNTILNSILAWLLPTFILVPLIIKWTRKYKIKST